MGRKQYVYMNKQEIITQIATLRHSAEQMENQVQKILSYCEHLQTLVEKPEVNWGMVALPVAAEDIGTMAIACVRRAVKLDTLITLAYEAEDREPDQATCVHAHTYVNDRMQTVCLYCDEELGR